jgi:non-specific serine/threonine protein kinase
VFVEGFDLEAGGGVAGLDDDALMDGVSSLVGKSLLTRMAEGPDADPRYRMLEALREYGLGAARGSGEEPAAPAIPRGADARPCRGGRVPIFSPDYVAVMAALDRDHDNIRTALTWLDAAGDGEATLRLARAMTDYWMLRGHLIEGHAWVERALLSASGADSATRAGALASAGWLAIFRGDLARAESRHTQAEALAERIGQPLLRAVSLMGLAMIHLERGDATRAGVLADAQVAIGRSVEPEDGIMPFWMSVILANRGQIALVQGDYALATACLHEAESRQRALGFSWALSDTLRVAGDLRRARGDHLGAIDAYRESVTLVAEHRDVRLLAHAVAGVAVTVAERGDPLRAARLLGASAGLRELSGSSVKAWDRATYERWETSVRAALPDDDFATRVGGRGLPRAGRARRGGSRRGNHAEPAPVGSVAAPGDQADPARLTAREHDVLRLIAAGLSDRDIADRLSISPRTVGGQVSNVPRQARRRVADRGGRLGAPPRSHLSAGWTPIARPRRRPSIRPPPRRRGRPRGRRRPGCGPRWWAGTGRWRPSAPSSSGPTSPSSR